MPDIPGHSAPQPDLARHTLTVRQVETMLAQAGVQRSHRHVLRLCQSGTFDAVKIPGGPTGEEWYIAPDSVPKAIGDLKQIDLRRAAAQPATSHYGAVKEASKVDTDTAGHSAPEPAVSATENMRGEHVTQPAAARHSAPELDIFEHPYVIRLEARCEKLEAKLEAQVRRTEEIQLISQEKLIELQRMTAVGNSKTLADFMLQAKNWLVGSSTEKQEPAAASAGQ